MLKFRTPIFAVTMLYLATWNIDLSILLGDTGSELVALGRWGAIAVVFMFFLGTLLFQQGGSLPSKPFLLALLLFPSVLLSEDIRFSTIEYVRFLSLICLYALCRAPGSTPTESSRNLGTFATCFVLLSALFIDTSSVFNTIGVLRGEVLDRIRSV